MRMVVDSSVLINVVMGEAWLPRDNQFVAPALLDSEVLATIRRLERAALLEADEADAAAGVADRYGVHRFTDVDLRRQALDVARRLGWARTYDAEYVALAEREGAPLVTDDVRLLRGAARLVTTVRPSEV